MTDHPMREISDLDSKDQKALLDINNAHQVETSYLSMSDWQHLIDIAFAPICINAPAFVIALDQDAPYANANFEWFSARYERFVYVDRIIVSEPGRGLGKILYHQLFERARQAGHQWIACEINSDPPNPASDAFHESMGFVEVGQAVLADKGKTVRYLVKDIEERAD